MAWGTYLRNSVSRTFTSLGNTATVYDYSSATTSENDEGDISVSDWKTGVSISYAPGDQKENMAIFSRHIVESTAETTIHVPYDTTIDIKDRILFNSINYMVDEVNEAIVGDVIIFKIVGIHKVTDTTTWS